MIFWILMIGLAAAGTIAIALGDTGTIGGMSGGMIASLIASISMLVFVVGGLSGYAGRVGAAVKDLAIWVGLAFVLVLGYSFRDDIQPLYQRVAGELLPPGTAMNVSRAGDTERAVRIRKRANGHFVVATEINGRSVTMLIDTGASKVVLTEADARAAGVDVSRLNFAIPVQTANGTGFAAAVRLDTVSVGGIRRNGLEALVAKPGALRESLLGMNYLDTLRGFEVTSDFMTLRG